jgi:hypothetical protein
MSMPYFLVPVDAYALRAPQDRLLFDIPVASIGLSHGTNANLAREWRND